MASQFSTVPTSSPAANQPIRRQPRGSINRRACQKCRHLKIKCDGDAENNVACSNCDQGTCIYDKSPRKNRQVERLNNRIETLENTLTETQANLEVIQMNYSKKTEEYNLNVDVLKLEKQILMLLFDCHDRFIDHPMVINQLRQVINESRCLSILLPVIQTLLIRLSQPQSSENTNNIIALLKDITDSTMSYCNPEESFNPSSTFPPNFVENIYSQFNVSDQSLTINEGVSTGISNLALHSPGSEVGSEMSNLSVHDYKIDLNSSTINIEITSPIDEASYYSHDASPVHSTSVNDFYGYPVDQAFAPFYDSSYGSNSSNNGQ